MEDYVAMVDVVKKDGPRIMDLVGQRHDSRFFVHVIAKMSDVFRLALAPGCPVVASKVVGTTFHDVRHAVAKFFTNLVERLVAALILDGIM